MATLISLLQSDRERVEAHFGKVIPEFEIIEELDDGDLTRFESADDSLELLGQEINVFAFEYRCRDFQNHRLFALVAVDDITQIDIVYERKPSFGGDIVESFENIKEWLQSLRAS